MPLVVQEQKAAVLSFMLLWQQLLSTNGNLIRFEQ